MNLRPDWCNDEKCRWLNGFDTRVCIGLMPRAKEHPKTGILNNLYLCFGPDDFKEINIADAVFISECLISGIKEVMGHGLYNPCQECGIDGDPINHLIKKLQGD
jgi:hypothetical protein